MLRINNIKLKPVKNETHSMLESRLIKAAKDILNIKNSDIDNINIVKKSIDARKNIVSVICTIDINVPDSIERIILKKNHNSNINKIEKVVYNPDFQLSKVSGHRPVVVGAGPCGLFCAYILALNGQNPIIVERGNTASKRKEDIEAFWKGEKLNTESNVQFGEGGAGTFSDGKLNTQVKDKTGRINFILDTFVKHGADISIKYDQHPHVGTDKLIEIITNLRNEIINLGGEFLFNTHMNDIIINDNKVCGVSIIHNEKNTTIKTDKIALCIGHSSRDTIRMLFDKGISMESKSFAVGLRVIHDQSLINKNQYGDYYDYFGSAPYKLTSNNNGRGVFSFCMCPGGFVVNASSENEKLAINGMSYSDRASGYANSAIIITVTPNDYDSIHPLAGISFQQRMEENAYNKGHGKIPVQYFGDYKNNTASNPFSTEAFIKGSTQASNLRGLFSEDMEEAFISSMYDFGKKIKGFDNDEVVLAGVESRTSSPVRIQRDESYCSNINGLFPGGEGAGYAGGITSAAVDGLKLGEAILLN